MPKSLADQLEAIVEGPGTKADRARALFRLGCDRSEVVELLAMSYSQAHSIYKRLQDDPGEQPGTRTGSTAGGRVPSKPTEARPLDGAQQGSARIPVSSRRSGLRLSPRQTRVVTQDGHRVVREDRQAGPACRNCGADLVFTLKWLAFVHAFSKKDPTKIEDNYSE